MKRFRFRLQRLERLRRMARMESRVALADALARLTLCRDRREAFEGSQQNAESFWQGTATRPAADGRQLQRAAGHLNAARSFVETARAAEQAALKDVESAQHEYVEKTREHRVLERLHEKAKQRWLEEGEREEQRHLDELYRLTSMSRSNRTVGDTSTGSG